MIIFYYLFIYLLFIYLFIIAFLYNVLITKFKYTYKDDIKDLIFQIDITLQKLNFDSKNIKKLKDKNSIKKNKRIPKIWKVQKLAKGNEDKTEIYQNISFQKLKNNSKTNSEIHNNEKIKIISKSNIKDNTTSTYLSKEDESKVNEREPLVFDITNKESLFSKKQRYYKIDFDKFYNLIEKTKDILSTLNKYEKVHRDQNYQYIYRMCKI